MNNPYRLLGVVMCVAGAVFAPISYFIVNSIALTVLGISAIMVGFTCIALANTRPYISPEACRLMLRTGMENTAALLEELGLTNQAVYFPSSMIEGHLQALVPLDKDANIQEVKQKLPGRLIVRFGPKPSNMAIAVATAGSMNIELLEKKPGPTGEEIAAAITYILTGVLDIADSTTVMIKDNLIDTEVKGSKLHFENVWYYRCLGSPVASIVAAISSEALDKPVRIKQESYQNGRSKITVEVLT